MVSIIHTGWRSGQMILLKRLLASRNFAEYPFTPVVIALDTLSNGLIVKTIFLDGILINENQS